MGDSVQYRHSTMDDNDEESLPTGYSDADWVNIMENYFRGVSVMRECVMIGLKLELQK